MSQPHPDPAAFSPEALADRLAGCSEKSVACRELPAGLIPETLEAAYAVQDCIVRQRGGHVLGWKVGSPSPDNPVIRCAPIPQGCLLPSGVNLPQSAFAHSGLELEIAVRFGRTMTAETLPDNDASIIAEVVAMAPAIELVSSRYIEWPSVPPLAQLADLQNHGVLIVGEFVPYRQDFPFVSPTLAFDFDADHISTDIPRNPAGDPRRLLPWLVRHCAARGFPITPDTVVTTGTYTGMHFPRRSGRAIGRIDGFSEISLRLV
ncbi:MAG TPA: hypothetical protein VL550_01140 [Rhodocyclaceae bacterium]|nr:hypothetical protein [Rhodocyclaceae bacterium]